MSRQAISCAVLLLVVTLPLNAADSKPATPASDDSWAPLPADSATPKTKPTADQTAAMQAEEKKLTVPLNHPVGYHDLTLKDGRVIRVQDQAHLPASNPSEGGRYDPENADFSRTSSYAHKDFSTAGSSLMKGYDGDRKSYGTSSYQTSGYDGDQRTFQTSAYRGGKGDEDFNKSYALPNPADFGKTFATKGSDLQGKSSTITKTSAPPTNPFAAPNALGDKAFYDPNLRNVKRDKYATAFDVKRLTDLPNRPLSIDEVRQLLNHETVPDLTSKPGEQSKALNDPDWQPDLKLPEISDRAAPATPPPDEAKDNELPSPGMMAQPQPQPSSHK